MPLRRHDRLLLAALCLGALAPAAAPTPARAQSNVPQELQVVDRIRFRGRRHVSEKALLEAMKTRPPSLVPWHERPVLRPDFLRADTAAIIGVYRQHGYLDAIARAHVRARPRDGGAEITFEINEGRLATVRAIEFEGVKAIPIAQLRQKIFTRRGHAFNPSALILDTLRIAEAYQDRGYRPSVAADTLRRADAITVRYHVVEGPLFHFGQVYYSSPGQLTVKRALIERELEMRPGDVYRTSRVQRSLERLYATDLFRSIQVTPLPDSANSLMEIDMRLEERKRRWVDAGIGSGTAERFSVNASWGHRNLLERGWTGIAGSRLSLDDNARFLLWHSELSAATPWLIGTRTTGQLTGYYEQSVDRTNDSVWVVHQSTPGVRFRASREFSRILKLTATQDNAFIRQNVVFTPTTGGPTRADSTFRYTTHLLNLSLDRDARDDPLVTTRGSLQSLSGEVAGGPLKGASSYAKGQVMSAWYTPLRTNWVFAAEVRAGMAAPFGSLVEFSPSDIGVDPQVARVPPVNRFHIGGVNSLRGFDENRVQPQGGLAMVQANAELRLPVWGLFGLEIYADAGNVWPGASDIRMEDFAPTSRTRTVRAGDVRYVFGVGPRLILPFGPLRLDITWIPRPLDRAPRFWYRPRLQFAIGPSF